MSNNNWIDVNDRLPDEGGFVYIHMKIALFHNGGFNDDPDEYGYHRITGVTHWQPLPSPPKQKDSE